MRTHHKNILLLSIVDVGVIGMLFVLQLSGTCQPLAGEIIPVRDSTPLTVHDLYTNSHRYNGKYLAVRGYYYEATEKVILASNVQVDDQSTFWRSVSSEQIWVGWNIAPPKEFYDQLMTVRGIRGPDYYGRVEVEGTFRIANIKAGENDDPELGVGHLGQYKHTFSIDKVSVFDGITQQYIPIQTTRRRK